MYGVVLMAALTTGAATENCCWGHGGCYGGGCYGGYSGCYGGCYGGSGYGGHYSGCYGGCYGGSGYGGHYSGCYGGCYGGGYYGSGYYGGGCYGVYGCAGCYGGWSCYGSGMSCYGGGAYYGGVVVPGGVPVPGGSGTGGAPPGEKLGTPNKQESRAKVIIDVPAQAKLFIDDQPMSNKAGQRTFVTPPLDRGQTYYYDVKIVLMVDGQEKVETQRVILRAGDEVAANFSSISPNGIATAQAKR